MNHKPLATLIASACLVVLSATAASAQQPQPKATRCDAVLTREEAIAIVGSGFEETEIREPQPGFTSCEWQGRDANFGFTFMSPVALQAEHTTAEEYFALEIEKVENDQRKREVLANIGLQAARVSFGDGAFWIVVQTAEGVAGMTFSKIADDKMLALARAVAVP